MAAAGKHVALVTGASKAVPLEFPELAVQRVHVPEAIDVLRSTPFGAIEAVARGYLSWLASLAAAHASELARAMAAEDSAAARVQARSASRRSSVAPRSPSSTAAAHRHTAAIFASSTAASAFSFICTASMPDWNTTTNALSE